MITTIVITTIVITTIVITTHNSSVAAQTDRVIRIVDGMVIEAAIGYQRQ